MEPFNFVSITDSFNDTMNIFSLYLRKIIEEVHITSSSRFYFPRFASFLHFEASAFFQKFPLNLRKFFKDEPSFDQSIGL